MDDTININFFVKIKFDIILKVNFWYNSFSQLKKKS